MDNDKIADVLDEAADLYESERYDWCQGQAITADGFSICASLALAMACGMTITKGLPRVYPPYHVWGNDMKLFSEPLYRAAEGALAPALGPGRGIVGFNDAKNSGRTKQDIIDLFKNTAKELRNGDQ